ncbi:MAG: hypothetical protein MHM6MM_003200 [Cercozoa sp. M6MM]
MSRRRSRAAFELPPLTDAESNEHQWLLQLRNRRSQKLRECVTLEFNARRTTRKHLVRWLDTGVTERVTLHTTHSFAFLSKQQVYGIDSVREITEARDGPAHREYLCLLGKEVKWVRKELLPDVLCETFEISLQEGNTAQSSATTACCSSDSDSDTVEIKRVSTHETQEKADIPPAFPSALPEWLQSMPFPANICTMCGESCFVLHTSTDRMLGTSDRHALRCRTCRYVACIGCLVFPENDPRLQQSPRLFECDSCLFFRAERRAIASRKRTVKKRKQWKRRFRPQCVLCPYSVLGDLVRVTKINKHLETRAKSIHAQSVHGTDTAKISSDWRKDIWVHRACAQFCDQARFEDTECLRDVDLSRVQRSNLAGTCSVCGLRRRGFVAQCTHNYDSERPCMQLFHTLCARWCNVFAGFLPIPGGDDDDVRGEHRCKNHLPVQKQKNTVRDIKAIQREFREAALQRQATINKGLEEAEVDEDFLRAMPSEHEVDSDDTVEIECRPLTPSALAFPEVEEVAAQEAQEEERLNVPCSVHTELLAAVRLVLPETVVPLTSVSLLHVPLDSLRDYLCRAHLRLQRGVVWRVIRTALRPQTERRVAHELFALLHDAQCRSVEHLHVHGSSVIKDRWPPMLRLVAYENEFFWDVHAVTQALECDSPDLLFAQQLTASFGLITALAVLMKRQDTLRELSRVMRTLYQHANWDESQRANWNNILAIVNGAATRTVAQ